MLALIGSTTPITCVRTGLVALLPVLVPAVMLAQTKDPRARLSLAELETRALRDSLDPDAQYFLALGYARKRRWDDEARALRAALAINPRYTPAYVALSFTPFQRRSSLGREVERGKVPMEWRDSLVESRRLLHHAFLIDPLAELEPPDIDRRREGISTVALNLALLRQYGSRPLDSLPPWVLWYQGMGAAHSGRLEWAIKNFQALVRRAEAIERDSIVPFPVGTNDYRYVLAVLYDRQGWPGDAIALYQQILGGDLGYFMAHTRLARLYRNQRMWTEAVLEARRAVETNPEDATTRRELGEILLAANRLQEAEAAVREAAAMNGRDLGTLYVLGVILAVSGQNDEARVALERFLTYAPHSLYQAQLNDAKQRLAALPP